MSPRILMYSTVLKYLTSCAEIISSARLINFLKRQAQIPRPPDNLINCYQFSFLSK